SSPPHPRTSRDPAARAAPGSGRALASEVLHRPPGRGARSLSQDRHRLPGRDETAAHLVQRRGTHTARKAAPGRHRPAPSPAVPGLVGNRAVLLGGHPQPAPLSDQVVLPLHRRRAPRKARPGHPSPRDPAEEHPGRGSGAPNLTGDEVKALLAEPGTASARAVRDTVLLALAYDTAARVQELCDLNVADIRRSKPMTAAIRGEGSKIRYVPVMDQTSRLVADYLKHRDPHPGLGADADPLFHGPNHSRLTRSGMAKLLARHVRAVQARDPGWAPGLPVTPHTLRRSRAMHLIQAGVNLIYIRDLLGHIMRVILSSGSC